MIYTDMTKKAMQLAYKAHSGQFDKGGVPYVFHPYEVARKMETEDEICTALLHDVVADTRLTLEDLKQEGFNDNVINAVKLLTRDREVSYEDYIASLTGNKLAVRVKLADLEHNSIPSRVPAELDEYMKKYYERYEKARKVLMESL